MVEVLRAGDKREPSRRCVGLVSNLSGIFGKQGCALLSNSPNARGYAYEDITAAVAETDLPVELDGDYAGSATIAGYTVVFRKNEPSHALAICDTPDGKRTVARTEDPALLRRMTQEEFCTHPITILPNGHF
jgi:hypothetical protein